MGFRFYTNMISQASRNVAAGITIVGLLLIGFGIIILVLPEVFAFLAAMVFFVIGIGFCVTALKIYLAQRRFSKLNNEEPYNYKETIGVFSDKYSSDDS